MYYYHYYYYHHHCIDIFNGGGKKGFQSFLSLADHMPDDLSLQYFFSPHLYPAPLGSRDIL